MEIKTFGHMHLAPAMELVRSNYQEERSYNPVLPDIENYPSLQDFANNGLGVCAVDGDKLLGFLGCWGPFANAFGSTKVSGVFSPIHGHGAIPENRQEIYARMYQRAAEKWVQAGAVSHGISLYAHDKAAREIFFQYGFGLRCIDSIRRMEPIATKQPPPVISCVELEPDDFSGLFSLFDGLVHHLRSSPSFLCYPPISQDEFDRRNAQQGDRYFAAVDHGRIIAYLKLSEHGETFVCDESDMISISGAFCLPEYRGSGTALALLNSVIIQLREEGYQRLGVDFESFNPTAYGFWKKYFTAYTSGMVRRIDENALEHS